MKLMRILLTFALLFALILPMNALANGSVEDQKGQSVDIVIIMDHSASMHNMKNGKSGNDTDDNRIIAAEMITAMVDMNGSRIAFIPFYNELFTDTVTFTDMSNFNSADSLRSEIAAYSEKLHKEMNGSSNFRDTNGGTDYGKPLAYAYNLLTEAKRQGSTNSPMIILLTDGSSDNPSKSKGLYFWNNSTELYTKATSTKELTDLVDYNGHAIPSFNNFKYDIDAVDKLARDVANRCSDAGIPIYTLPLYGADEANSKHIQLLNDLADITGGLSAPLSSENADQLPVFFGDMFANKIGSKQRVLDVEKVGSSDKYIAKIPLLNKSVQEANIYIPLKYVNPHSIKLLDRDGNERTEDDNEIIRIDIPGAFVLYKLRVKSPLGIWKLQFRSIDGAQPEDISFSLLYNYNISLESQLVGNAKEISKSGNLELISYFVENENKKKSDDRNLYVPCQDNLSEDDKIKFTYQLLNEFGNPIDGANGVFEKYDEANMQMTATLDLSPFGLTAGDYSVQITAEGAGMYRTNRIPITLKNNAPTSSKSIQEDIYVDYANTAENSKLPLRINLNKYASDADYDTLTFSNLSFTAGSDRANTSISGSDLIIDAAADPNNPGFKAYGTQTGKVIASDGNGGTCEINFSINVKSGWAEAQDSDYKGETNSSSNVTIDKNTAINFKAYRVIANTTNKQSIDDITCEVVITDDNDRNKEIARIALSDNGYQELEGTYTTGNTSCSWTATYYFKYGSTDVATVPTTITVNNTAPQCAGVEAVAHLLPQKLTHNASWFEFIETEKPTATVDLTQLFSDADNEQGLVYTLDTDTAANSANLDCQVNGTTLTLTGKGTGIHTYTIIAADGDGETAIFTATVEVVDLFIYWGIRALILIAAFIALIVLFIVMCQRAKPRFSNKAMLNVTIGNMMYGTTTQPPYYFSEMRKPKKPLLLNAVVTPETCDTVQFGYADLASIKLEPVKGSDKLRLTLMKKTSSFDVKLNNDDTQKIPVKKKLYISLNQEITLQATSSPDAEHCVHIIYCLGTPAPDVDDIYGFMGGNGIGGSNGNSNGFDDSDFNNFGTGSSTSGFSGGSASDFSGGSASDFSGGFSSGSASDFSGGFSSGSASDFSGGFSSGSTGGFSDSGFSSGSTDFNSDFGN